MYGCSNYFNRLSSSVLKFVATLIRMSGNKKGAVKPLLVSISSSYISMLVQAISPSSPIFSQNTDLALSRVPTL